MPKNLVQIQAVSDDGTLRPEAAEPGARYVLLKAPRVPETASDALQGPRALVDDVVTYLREHRELSRKQYREFTERYGDPRNKLKRYADKLTPEEWERRTQEFNAYVQTRFEDLSRDMETRYEKLENEFDATVERIFGRKSPETPAAEAEVVEALNEKVEAADEAQEAEEATNAEADSKEAEKASA